MNKFITIISIIIAFITLNITFGGIKIVFDGIPFGIISVIFCTGLFAGIVFKK